jgi:hypothetical protein
LVNLALSSFMNKNNRRVDDIFQATHFPRLPCPGFCRSQAGGIRGLKSGGFMGGGEAGIERW